MLPFIAKRINMAKSKLNPYPIVTDNLIFWLKRYLKFKIMTLSNEKADEEVLKKALIDLDKAKTFDEVDKIIKAIKNQIPIYTYYYPISNFLKWLCGVIETLEDIDTELVLEWLTFATTKKSQATKLNYKNVLMNFLKYVESENKKEHHFNIKLSSWQKNLKNIATKKADYLSEDEIDKFLQTLNNFKFVKQGHRDKVKEDFFLKALYTLAIKLALYGGLRISEIANLKLDDLRVNQELDVLEIYIQKSKNNKYRIVTIPYSKGKYAIKEDLDNYLEKRKGKCKELKDLLFFTHNCKKLSSFTMERVLSRILKEAGILTNKKGMHLLRHTHASFFYKKTQDVLLLKERLGHDNVKTTMRYTHLDEEKIKKSANVLR